MDIKTQTYKLIDDLKAVCHNYGMGNDGNEYKVITQIFLYKFLNDKFGYEIKQKDERIAKAEKWETAYSEMSEDDRLDLLDCPSNRVLNRKEQRRRKAIKAHCQRTSCLRCHQHAFKCICQYRYQCFGSVL